MPSYITPTALNTCPVLEPGIPGYCFGHLSGYNDPTYGDGKTEYAEAVPANGTYSRQFNLRKLPGFPNQERSVTWQTEFPSAPATVSVSLVGAITDNGTTSYAIIDTSTNAAGEVRAVSQDKIAGYNFLAIVLTSSTGGTSPTIIAKISL